MEVLTSNYYIADIKKVTSNEVPRSSLLLWVWHADKIPPHIGISHNDSYYSLKANGKDEGLSISLIESIIERKSIRTLCFEISDELICENINSIFVEYNTTIPDKVTCLAPIKNILKNKSANQLVDLLTELYDSDSINNVFGFNLDEEFKGIKNYSISDIHSRLQKLSNE